MANKFTLILFILSSLSYGYLVQPSQRLKIYSVPQVNDLQEPVDFSCPGDSLLTGISSRYDYIRLPNGKLFKDRRFRFTCTFLEDKLGRVIKAFQCQDKVATSTTPTTESSATETVASEGVEVDFSTSLTTEAEPQAESLSCDKGRFINGWKSKIDFKSKTRTSHFQCCSMFDWEYKPILENACKKYTQKTPKGKDFSFNCSKGSVLKSFESTYEDDDRSYAFECCNLGRPD